MKTLPSFDVRLLAPASDGARRFVNDIDATLNHGGDLDLLWATTQVPKPYREVWHGRLTEDPTGWSGAARIDGVQSGPRVAECNDVFHLVARDEGDGRPVQLVAGRRPGSWRSLGSVLRGSDGAQAYDVVMVDSLLIIAFLGYRRVVPDAPFDHLPVQLSVAEIPAHGAVTYHDLATFPHIDLSRDARPHLTRWRGEVHLVCSFGAVGAPYRTLHAYRASDGTGWSTVTDIGSAETQWAANLALAATHDRLFVFFEGGGLEAIESVDGRRWSPPVRVAEVMAWGSSEAGRSIAASADSDAVIVAWTDFAIGVSRIPPLVISNPWMHQDVLAIASTAHPATLANLAASPLTGITPESGYLRGVVTCSGDGWHHVAWIRNAGRPEDSSVIGVARIPVPAN